MSILRNSSGQMQARILRCLLGMGANGHTGLFVPESKGTDRGACSRATLRADARTPGDIELMPIRRFIDVEISHEVY
jgi:6-phosphogluconolactonase/glucosamine-6-phosphate isomerase/deaminase